MYQLDIFGNPEPLSIYLAKVDGSIIGCLDNIIVENNSNLSVGINKQFELDLEIIKSEDDNWYDYLHEGMYLFVEKIGLFKMNQPSISNNGTRETKSIRAYSVESELEDKTIAISINTGKKDSMEYLVQYDANETEELVNPYTGIPYDWIMLYNAFPEQLELFKYELEHGEYGSGDEKTVTDATKMAKITALIGLIPRLQNKIVYSNNPDGSKDSTLVEYIIPNYTDGILSSYTLTAQLGSRITTLITFYTKYRNQLSLLPLILEGTDGAWTVGTIWGFTQGEISGNDYSLVNKKFQFDTNETIYSFLTQALADTTKCIINFDRLNRTVSMTPIEHFGNDTGIVIGYDTLVNSLEIATDEDKLATQLVVSGGDDLGIERVNFGSDRIDDLTYKMNALGSDGKRIYVSDSLAAKYATYLAFRETKRERYIELSKLYESYSQQISDIENRVPNDDLKTDWGTFTQDELRATLTSYKNLMATLKSLYKSEYGAAGMNQDGSINENYIKNTEYWWDYDAYKSIIVELECALAVYPYYSDQSYWTTAQINEYKNAIVAWETDWSLFGTVELQAKIDAYKQNMDVMLEEQEGVGSGESKSTVIRKYSYGYEIKQWSELTNDEKASYGNSSDCYHYSTYMTYYNNANSAQTYLDSLVAQVDSLVTQQESAQAERISIVDEVQIATYFTASEAKIINRLLRASDYQNDNIISTSIDTSSQKIDTMYELLEDAKNEVSKTSRPQLTFAVNADNILALTEFEALWDSFYPGNFLFVQYRDNTYVKLRLVGFSFNPSLPSANNLSVEFSNFTRSRAEYNDWGSLFGESSGKGGSSKSKGGSSGSGYGESDDIDVTISNTMLAKLLNTEMFGTRVKDVILDTIDVNKLTARFATFGGLSKGTTTIDGKCIQTGYIIDQFYNGTNGGINNTAGSIINLETGKFNLGGGKLKFDIVQDVGVLNVEGHVKAQSLSTGSKTSSATGQNGLYIDGSGNLYAGSSNQVKIYADGDFSFGADKILYDNGSLSITVDSLYIGSDSVSDLIADAAKVASNYLSYTANDGVTVGYSGLYSKVNIKGDGIRLYNSNGNLGEHVKADGVDLYSNGKLVAALGSASVTFYNSSVQYGDTLIPLAVYGSTGVELYGQVSVQGVVTNKKLADFKTTGISFDDGTPFTIGVDSGANPSYIKWVYENNQWKIKIAADMVLIGGSQALTQLDQLTVDHIEYAYKLSTSGTTIPTGTWSSTPVAPTETEYAWTRTTTVYSDGSSAITYTVGGKQGTHGTNGTNGTSVWVSSTSITYATSWSGTTAPSSGWQTSVPSVSQGAYLWTKTYVLYSDGNSTTTYSTARQGENGVDITSQYMYFVSSGTYAGLNIKYSSYNNRVILNASGLTVYDSNNVDVANFSSTVRIGKSSDVNINIGNDVYGGKGIIINNSSTMKARLVFINSYSCLSFISYEEMVISSSKAMQINTSSTTSPSESQGAIEILAEDGGISLRSKGCTVCLARDGAVFRPGSDQSYSCGSTNYRWNKVYCIESTLSTSDRKEKDISGDIDFAKDLIMALNPIDFYWKNGDHRRKRMGFIAQEVSAWCKDHNLNLNLYTASYKGDDITPYYGEEVDDNQLVWGMSYGELIAPMVKVIQEQERRISELENTISLLEAS